MALTPYGWIPSPGPLAGSQVPEMSWGGGAAAVAFCSLASPDSGDGVLCGNASGEKVTVATTTITEILKRFNIFGAPHRHSNWNFPCRPNSSHRIRFF